MSNMRSGRSWRCSGRVPVQARGERQAHAYRAMKENARQGFWTNGALPPITGLSDRAEALPSSGGHRTKLKSLEDRSCPGRDRAVPDLPPGARGQRKLFGARWGVKSIATHLNAIGIRTRDGGRWGKSMPSTRRADPNDLHRPASVQYQVLEDPRAANPRPKSWKWRVLLAIVGRW